MCLGRAWIVPNSELVSCCARKLKAEIYKNAKYLIQNVLLIRRHETIRNLHGKFCWQGWVGETGCLGSEQTRGRWRSSSHFLSGIIFQRTEQSFLHGQCDHVFVQLCQTTWVAATTKYYTCCPNDCRNILWQQPVTSDLHLTASVADADRLPWKLFIASAFWTPVEFWLSG